MVSSEVAKYRAQLVRLIHGDSNPAGPGYREEPLPSSIERTYAGRRQTIVAGSYIRSASGASLNLADGLTVQAWVWPTTPTKPGGQGLLACWSTADESGFAFGVDGDGHLTLELGLGSSPLRVVHPGPPLVRWQWSFVAATFDPAAGSVCLYQAASDALAPSTLALHRQQIPVSDHAALPTEHLLIAARALDTPGEDGRRHLLGAYNGKIDRPRLFDRPLTPDEIAGLQQTDSAPSSGLLAEWDFAASIESTHVPAGSAHHLDGQTVNQPTRAVTDHTWSGREVRWRDDPSEYAAIHFHDDDLEDAGWQPDFELTIPETFRSGVYAVRLSADADEEYIPFYVRPAFGKPTAPVAFLAPTLTYLAYANERMYWNEGYLQKRARITPLETTPPDIDRYMAEHRELGLSLYDVHSDGSGCSYSSRLRPILNMRPKYRAWRLHDSPRHFAADLYAIAWLEARGFDYDVITDEDVHAQGAELLAGYRVVLTGSHPEYHTDAMHTGFRQYLERGGRLMYLGGNGFYWVTSVDPRRPHLIELRRGVSGTRAWESLPGENYHSTTGELGGLWRLRGWSPQRLVGVGFAAQGWGGAAGYTRLPASHDPRAAFVFEGVADAEVIGNFGLVLNGAAGDEIDRFDPQLGSPPQALLLATSAGQHTDYYQLTVEDVPIMVPGQGGRESPKVRADMVLFETPNGGAVFSVGSINWLGSLGWNAYHNNVARVTENVLRRFLDPQPLSPAE
jgi:N,N-dimethylformamidase